MSNSVLSLMFPLSGEKCTNVGDVDTGPVLIPLPSRKIFAPSHLCQSQFCTIYCSPVSRKHLRSLIFQSYVSKANVGGTVIILTNKKWPEVPFDVQKCGVHNMPKLELNMFERLSFVFPKTFHELFLFVSAIGSLGPDDLPDLLILENIEELLSKNVDDGEPENRMDLQGRLTKLFSMLANFSKEAFEKKMIRIIVTSSDKTLQSSFSKFNIWCDELWCLGEEDNDQELVFRLCVNPCSGVQLRFSFDSNTKEYFLTSLSIT
jgi:hypothetical protein